MLSHLQKQLSVPDIHLLIASPDMATVKNIFSYLEPKGYQLDSAASADEVWNCLNSASYDAILLESRLVGDSGIPLYTCLRIQGHTMPIILLVPESGMDELPRYVNGGADDILTTPLHMLELEARTLARIRLARVHMSTARLNWAGLELDARAHTVTCDGEPMHLPPLAFSLLAVLMKAAPNVVSRTELEKELYGGTPPNSDSLRTYIHLLRSKLEKSGKPILATVPRIGFRLLQG